MRRLTAFVCLTLAVLLFSATEGFALPSCPTDRHVSTWTDCFGTYTYANGQVDEGVWENNEFKYTKKISPTVTADKAAERRVAEEKRQAAAAQARQAEEEKRRRRVAEQKRRAEAERLAEEELQRTLKEEERRERFATLTRGLVAADVVAAIVNDGVKLRALPEHGAEAVKELRRGRQVQVTGVLPTGWLQVSEEGKPVGWVFKTAVATEAAAKISTNQGERASCQ